MARCLRRLTRAKARHVGNLTWTPGAQRGPYRVPAPASASGAERAVAEQSAERVESRKKAVPAGRCPPLSSLMRSLSRDASCGRRPSCPPPASPRVPCARRRARPPSAPCAPSGHYHRRRWFRAAGRAAGRQTPKAAAASRGCCCGRSGGASHALSPPRRPGLKTRAADPFAFTYSFSVCGVGFRASRRQRDAQPQLGRRSVRVEGPSDTKHRLKFSCAAKRTTGNLVYVKRRLGL